MDVNRVFTECYFLLFLSDSIGESAIKFMSQGKLTQRFPFQVVGKVNFDDENSNSLRNAIRKLKDSKIKRVLLMVHNRYVKYITREVSITPVCRKCWQTLLALVYIGDSSNTIGARLLKLCGFYC